MILERICHKGDMEASLPLRFMNGRTVVLFDRGPMRWWRRRLDEVKGLKSEMKRVKETLKRWVRELIGEATDA
jgi:hypothetical protein